MARLLCLFLIACGAGSTPGGGDAFTPGGRGDNGNGPSGVTPVDPTPTDDDTTPMPGPDPMDGPQQKANLEAPTSIRFGVRTDNNFTAQTLVLKNTGNAAVGALALSLEGTWVSLSSTAVDGIAPGAQVAITLTPSVTGAGERIHSAKVRIKGDGIDFDVPAYAAVADPNLPAILDYQSDEWTDARLIAELPRAPWPNGNANVHMSLPKSFRKSARRADVLIALHGHGGVLEETLPAKKYVEQAYVSNRNAVLIVPQGLYDQAADDFGQLRQQDGVRKLAEEVLIALYREEKIEHPVLGRVAISSHSGGYNSLSDMLTKSGVPLSGVILLDSLYGWEARYEAWIETQVGKFVTSNQNSSGNSPTDNSDALKADISVPYLEATGRPLPETVVEAQNLFHRTHYTHGNVPMGYYSLSEFWRGSLLDPKASPAPVLRRAALSSGVLEVDFYAEPSMAAKGFRIQTSTNGSTFSSVEVAGTSDLLQHIEVPFTAAAAWVRVTALHDWLGESAPTDTYFVRAGTGADKVLIVDAFDRMVDGAFHGLTHDFAGRVGGDIDAGSSVVSCADEAVEIGACELSGSNVVVWLAGLDGILNPPLDAPGRSALTSFIAGGGRAIVSGAELAYALTNSEIGAGTFVSSTLGVSGYIAGSHDDAGTNSAYGYGALASVTSFDFGGVDSYPVDFPDILPPAGGAATVLRYSTGSSAAVMITDKIISVGFPLETITPDGRRGEVVRALVSAVR